MKRVDFLKTTEKGQRKFLTLGWDGSTIQILKGTKQIADAYSLFDKPILGKQGREYWFYEGEEFLRNLKYQFSGSYVRATDVYEK